MYYTIQYYTVLYYTILYYTQHIFYQCEAVLSTCVPWGESNNPFTGLTLDIRKHENCITIHNRSKSSYK